MPATEIRDSQGTGRGCVFISMVETNSHALPHFPTRKFGEAMGTMREKHVPSGQKHLRAGHVLPDVILLPALHAERWLCARQCNHRIVAPPSASSLSDTRSRAPP